MFVVPVLAGALEARWPGYRSDPNAAERTRVIGGDLELACRLQQPCTPGEQIGGLLAAA